MSQSLTNMKIVRHQFGLKLQQVGYVFCYIFGHVLHQQFIPIVIFHKIILILIFFYLLYMINLSFDKKKYFNLVKNRRENLNFFFKNDFNKTKFLKTEYLCPIILDNNFFKKFFFVFLF